MAQDIITTEIFINEKSIQNKIENLIDDDVMIEIHNLFAKMCDPYVPKEEGVLSQTLEVTKDYVRYTQPYAHYQYMGNVYGPNIPIIKDGVIVGWFSPPGKGSKHPTGKNLNYSTEQHPKATSKWDKAMMDERGDEFIEQVKDILVRKAKELYG
jgi:hypothetical protein